MKTRSFAIVTMALAVALGMAMCAPLTGCSGCSASRESDFIEKSADGKPTKKKEADQTKAHKTKDSAVGTDTKTGQEAASATTDTKADSSESKSSTPCRQLQAKPAPVSLRSPTATDRSLQCPRRNGCPSRAIGRRITAKYGYPTSSTRATSAIGSSPITEMSDRSIPSQPQTLGSTTIRLTAAVAALCSMTPIPSPRTKATTSNKLRDSIGSWTSQGTGSRSLGLSMQ